MSAFGSNLITFYGYEWVVKCSYVMGIGEAEAFSERLKRELQALEAANVHAILETEPLVDEVNCFYHHSCSLSSCAVKNHIV